MAPLSTLINKLKVQLKLSISRLRMVRQKDEALAKQQRRAMAGLLEQGKEESARIRVENIIRSDMNSELLEILELYCELLIARVGLLEAKECDAGLEEAVKSIIFAAPKIEGVKELTLVRALLAEKYGKDFTLQAMENTDGKVAKRVSDRLKVEPPPKELVEAYLSTIAEAYNIDWPPGSRAKREAERAAADDDDNDDEPSSGEKVALTEDSSNADALSKATPPSDMTPRSPISVNPPAASTDNVRPRVNLPGPPGLTPSKKMTDAAKKNPVNGAKTSDSGPGGKIPDVNELAKRFANLKR